MLVVHKLNDQHKMGADHPEEFHATPYHANNRNVPSGDMEIRLGDNNHKGGIAVILSNGEDGLKNMQTASPDTTYIDITEHVNNSVLTNNEGWGKFRCLAGSVSVWVPE